MGCCISNNVVIDYNHIIKENKEDYECQICMKIKHNNKFKCINRKCKNDMCIKCLMKLNKFNCPFCVQSFDICNACKNRTYGRSIVCFNCSKEQCINCLKEDDEDEKMRCKYCNVVLIT